MEINELGNQMSRNPTDSIDEIKKIEKISLGKKERVEKNDFVVKKSDGKSYINNDTVIYEDEFFGFNIYYDDGKKDTKVSILSVGDLNEFYEEGGYLGKIKQSKQTQ